MSGHEASPGQPEPDPPRLCVLLSGSGRTLENLLEVIAQGRLAAQVALVISSRACRGEEIARRHGVPFVRLSGEIPRADLTRILREAGVDWVVLAGYLKKVAIPPGYEGRVVNIHPALLPRHGGPGMYGDRVHRSVLASGDVESGCTVHLCDDEYDRGRIVLQKRCPVEPGDDEHTLARRVFELEKLAYPEALATLFRAHP